ncbi:MAG TPA: glycoside hydrolase family 44 [Prolixibacteraceae bacterium]|nr:glycoside hydrolase family 44 [Prolixibacteraceae bacterium]
MGFAQTPIRIDIDLTKGKKPVSPYLYGKNNVLPKNLLGSGTTADITKAKEAGVRFVRQGGGNNSTKYNWRNRLSSHPDWYNNVYDNNWDAAAKNLMDKMPGVQGMWSFQILGKSAANTKNNFNDWAYNTSKWWTGVNQNLAGGGQVNTAGGSKALVEGNPDLYLMDWPADSTVGILDKWFGAKGLGYDKTKIRYWNMDNEPEIWSGTHDDVMKTQCTAEEFMQLYFKVAKAARAKYPDIKLVGPVPANEWQWYRWGSDAILYNGKRYCWLEYFILRISEEEKVTGIKLLDVLDIHFYPGETDATNCVQLHRVYFDRNFVYPGANGVHTVTGGWDTSINKEYILGRCSDWLVKYKGASHGVTFGITETDIGSTNPNVQALWYASTMGEFMKNGVEIFTPWSWKVGMWEALHLFSRYNQENFVQATSQNEVLISAYPTVNEAADSMTVVLVNRHQTAKQTVNLNFAGYLLQDRTYSMYSISGLTTTETFVSHTNNKLAKQDVIAAQNQITVELAPLSVNSIILKAAPVSSDKALQNGRFNAKIYPNPASDQVNLEFSLPEKSKLTIALYQANGMLSKTICNTAFESGNHQIEINSGYLSSGIYWIRFISETETKTIKLIK